MTYDAARRLPDVRPWRTGDIFGMTGQSVTTPVTTAYAPLRWGVHLLVAASIGIVSPFTGFAWPFATVVGMAMGSAHARRLRGQPDVAGDGLMRGIAIVFGVLGMLFFGVIIGGLVAIVVVVLASFSEKAAAYASPTDRGVARILLFIVPIIMWFIVFPLLGVNVNVRIGG